MSAFKFSVGPWNVHAGADSYGPATRNEIDFEEKLAKLAQIGFSAIQFHDDDAVPNINDYTEEEITTGSSFKTDLALSSFDTACVIDEIEEAMGVRIDIKDFVTYKTVGEMADYIASLK